MRTISMIVAMSSNRAIGKDNQLLWHLPADLKHFKALTTGHSIIMGRKTYDSIGRALPNRRNIVISRQKDLQLTGAEVFHELETALAATAQETETFIIGGANIYAQALPFTQKIYLTQVHTALEGDAYFPNLNLEEWETTQNQHFKKDEKNPYDYDIITLERRKI